MSFCIFSLTAVSLEVHTRTSLEDIATAKVLGDVAILKIVSPEPLLIKNTKVNCYY